VKLIKLFAALIPLTLLVAASCPSPVPPNPVPVETGGTAPVAVTGGAGQGGMATGGARPDAGSPFEQCVAAQSQDPAIQNVAKRTGTPLKTLVARICSDAVLQGGYR
jgi:hypothetical protein